MTPLTLPSPAKINLFLHITGQREDGYHNLQTIFQLLDYGDTLSFSPSANNSLQLTGAPGAIDNPDNLILRAARLLQSATGCNQGAIIKLEKKLPMGGGLGGGSSNAATTLLGLNQLWQTGCSLDRLAELGQSLGADVPVFIRGQTAWGEGTGEILTPLTTESGWYLVLKPPVNINTGEIFADPELTRQHSPIKMAAFFAGQTVNDCQKVVCKRCPEVVKTLNWLEKYSPARLTGTGACVFAKFDDEPAAHAVLEQIPEGLQGFVATGTQWSTLHTALGLIPGS